MSCWQRLLVGITILSAAATATADVAELALKAEPKG